MSEWWTYRPSDFLLFAPRTYYRLVELHNAELWPAHAVAIGVCLVLVAMAWRGWSHAGRVTAATLAVAWGFVGWRFHWHHYATINWAAVHFAVAFAVQAVLLTGAAVTGAVVFGAAPRARRYVGLALVVTALALLPLAALALGRPLRQLEVPGLSPDPTALLTLGLLLVARRAHWSLFMIPLSWCAVSALTLWTMNAADAWIPLLGGALALTGAVAWRPHSVEPVG
jgi:hypothetical protein